MPPFIFLKAEGGPLKEADWAKKKKKRERERERKCFKGTVKHNLKLCHSTGSC